jgi:hypothetical protein
MVKLSCVGGLALILRQAQVEGWVRARELQSFPNLGVWGVRTLVELCSTKIHSKYECSKPRLLRGLNRGLDRRAGCDRWLRRCWRPRRPRRRRRQTRERQCDATQVALLLLGLDQFAPGSNVMILHMIGGCTRNRRTTFLQNSDFEIVITIGPKTLTRKCWRHGLEVSFL